MFKSLFVLQAKTNLQSVAPENYASFLNDISLYRSYSEVFCFLHRQFLLHLTFYEILFIKASHVANLQASLFCQKINAKVHLTTFFTSPLSLIAPLWSANIFQANIVM